ncbi:MAG: LamG-like jellyroll fold domain-containing protein [Thermoguttaceae bacterium]
MPRAIVTGICGLVLTAAAAAADEGLVGHWSFDKAGSRIADRSGRGHDAVLAGTKPKRDKEQPLLRLDGGQTITVPSAAELNLKKGFTIETRFRLADLKDGRLIVFKDQEYQLRVDWGNEGNSLSFFVYVGGQWESRVRAYTPALDHWYHVVASWDGRKAMLWVNGEPFSVSREGPPPPPTANPLCIGSGMWKGANFVGSIEYVKIYAKVLPTTEIVKRAYGIGQESAETISRQAEFDFADGLQGWQPREGATARISNSRLLAKSPSGRGFILRSALQVPVEKKDYLALRMALDRGSRGELIFVTTEGAGRVPFPTRADRKPHTYVFEPWTWAGWGGTLLALGLVPSELPGSAAVVKYLRLMEQPQAEPELEIAAVFPESTLPRAEREETVVVRLRNAGGKATGAKATLFVPEGVTVQGPAEQPVADLGYLGAADLRWKVVASRPTSGEVRVTLAADGEREVTSSQAVRFLANPRLPKATYVPEPVPARTGKYTIWTHYCPLWKHGTHNGWKLIEPWPERKPVIGWYNEGEPEVADWHIKQWLEHGISGVVYCWYRTNLNAPVTQQLGHAIHDGLLKARYIDRIKFAIMWENGCGQGVGSTKDLMENVLPFWIENYFSHPSYQRVNGKPLLYIWVPSNVTKHLGSSEEVRKTFDAMRAVCRQKGLGGLYIVGCIGGQNREALEAMVKEGWDASSAYGADWRPPQQVRTVGDFVCAPFEGFIDQQEQIWKFKRRLGILPDITAVMMGWDSRPWKETPFFWSENTPQKFRDLCLRAKAVMDAGPDKNPVIFCCWNEFGEGHYIEPTRGYGFSYLDVIRDVFTAGPKEHLDIAPEDVGMRPCDSWYREARQAVANESAATDSWSDKRLAAWNSMMGLGEVKLDKGVLRAQATSDDPAFSLNGLRLRAGRYARVVVEMRVSRPGGAQLFWSTVSHPDMTEDGSLTLPTAADGQFHRYAFDVAKNGHWGGCVTALRFDPTAKTGVVVEIRSIALE